MADDVDKIEKVTKSSHEIMNSIVSQTIVANHRAPRLKVISTKHFYVFLKERVEYEKQVDEKNSEQGIDITEVSYQ